MQAPRAQITPENHDWKNEPHAARPEKTAQLGGSVAVPVEKSTGSRQKEKQGCAKVSDPTGKEERVIGAGQSFRFIGQVTEEVSAVVERHNNHHDAAQNINGRNAVELWLSVQSGCSGDIGRLDRLRGQSCRGKFDRCLPLAFCSSERKPKLMTPATAF